MECREQSDESFVKPTTDSKLERVVASSIQCSVFQTKYHNSNPSSQMTDKQRPPLILVALASSILLAAVPAAQAKTPAAEPQTYAVLFYADWCGSCKTLDPKVTEARQSLADSPILFLTFDLTDDASKHQSAMLAEAVGLDSLYTENGGKTGYLAIVEASSGKVLGKLTKSDSAEAIAAKLRDSAKS